MRYSALICFSSYEGSVNSLVMKDHVEVCLLSHRIMLQSLSGPLQVGIRFFHNPLPTPLLASLAGRFPLRERYGFPKFRMSNTDGLDPASPPIAIMSV
jgi:hypothetical protein